MNFSSNKRTNITNVAMVMVDLSERNRISTTYIMLASRIFIRSESHFQKSLTSWILFLLNNHSSLEIGIKQLVIAGFLWLKKPAQVHCQYYPPIHTVTREF